MKVKVYSSIIDIEMRKEQAKVLKDYLIFTLREIREKGMIVDSAYTAYVLLDQLKEVEDELEED